MDNPSQIANLARHGGSPAGAVDSSRFCNQLRNCNTVGERSSSAVKVLFCIFFSGTITPRVVSARLGSAPMQKFVKMLLFMLMSFSATLAAAPVGYSINADSPTDNADSLYRIDLATGAETRIAPVRALGLTRIDVEGLAFAADGTLYAADDDTLTFFPLNPDNALVDVANETTIELIRSSVIGENEAVPGSPNPI